MYVPDSGGESVLYIICEGDIKSCIERGFSSAMQWGYNKSCEELLQRGLIHLCVKDNKTVPLLD